MRARAVVFGIAMVAGLAAPPAAGDTIPEQVLAAPPTTVASADVNHGFEVVGHSSLNLRGNNAAIALAGDCVYVGNRGYDAQPVLVVDVADPSRPAMSGQLPDTKLSGVTTRELRTSPRNHLLVVMTYAQSLGRRSGANMLMLYDISDCRAPVRVGTLDLGAIRPHEFFLWEDPARPERVIAYVTTPFGPPQLVVADLTDPRAPAVLTAWEGLYPQPLGREADNSGVASYLHSLSVSPDGRRGYLAYWDAGYYEIDTSMVADGHPAPVIAAVIPAMQAAGAGTGYTFRADPDETNPARLTNAGNTHTAVPLERDGRTYVALTDEAYDGLGQCPYGWFHLVDATDPLSPRIVSEYRLEQQDVSWCDANTGPGTAPRGATWSSHNLTMTPNLAFVAWHAGGLQAIDLSNPAELAQAGSFVPTPVTAAFIRPAELQEYLGDHPVLMWSYPVISNGLIYVLDIRNGLYILRYTGPHAEEVAAIGFSEGNSNVTSGDIVPSLTAPGASAPVVRADLPQPAAVPSVSGGPALACLLP